MSEHNDKLYEYKIVCDAKVTMSVAATSFEEAERKAKEAITETGSNQVGADYINLDLQGAAYRGRVVVPKNTEIKVLQDEEIPGQDVAF